MPVSEESAASLKSVLFVTINVSSGIEHGVVHLRPRCGIDRGSHGHLPPH